MRVKQFALCVGLVAASLVAGGGGTQVLAAPQPQTTIQTSTIPVEPPPISPRLQAYLETLNPADQSKFINSKLPASITTTLTVTKETITPSESSRASAAQATGCWRARLNGQAKSALGNTLFTYYHLAYWCSSGLTITTSRWDGAGGETSTPGWRYEGVINKGAGVVLNQGRSYSQFRFVLGAGGIDVQSPTPCLRVKGTNTGGIGRDLVCGIY